jgi:hypothetical protein
MKETGAHWSEYFTGRAYRINARHFAYVAGKLMCPRDAFEAILALLVAGARDAVRHNPVAVRAVWESAKGFAHGLRHRSPVRAEVSRTFRMNFHSYASPWWFSRPPARLLLALPAGLVRLLRRKPKPDRPPGRRDLYYASRARYYPDSAATLQF